MAGIDLRLYSHGLANEHLPSGAEKRGYCMQKTVSVIVPIYNAGESLRDCLDCVCNQTLQDIEVICIDDCSIDDSVSVVQEYCTRYSFVKLICQPENMGSGPARNRGLEHAMGEYVAFLDADDHYASNDTLRMLYDTAKRENALICGGGLSFFGEAEKMKKVEERCGFVDNGWVDFYDYQMHIYYQRFLFQRAMLEKEGIRFPHYLRFQDPPFMVRAMLAAGRFYAVNQTVYAYRNDVNHVLWSDAKINDFLSGNRELLDLCLKNRLGILYREMLNRYNSNKRLKLLLGNALINGNDKVASFYRYVYETLDQELMGEDITIEDLSYIETLAAWDCKREYRYCARDIGLVDVPMAIPPKVSVIIPAYNTEKYIEEMMETICKQTLADIEIICIDDGSTDQTGAILDAYQQKDGRIRVYHQNNQGLSAARNVGLQHAQGTYCYFMDSDDLLDEEALEKLYLRAEENQLDIVYFAAESFFDDGMTEEEKSLCKLPLEYSRRGDYPAVTTGVKMLIYQNQYAEAHFPVSMQMLRTSFLRQHKLAFFEGILHEDNLFTTTAQLYAQRAGCMDNAFFHRRIRKNSIMTTKRNYRNVLGMFMSVVELMRLLPTIQLQVDEKAAVNEMLQKRIARGVFYQWMSISEADQLLLRASLNKHDQTLFEMFIVTGCNLIEDQRRKAIAHGKKLESVQQKYDATREKLKQSNARIKVLNERLQKEKQQHQREMQEIQSSFAFKIANLGKKAKQRIKKALKRK